MVNSEQALDFDKKENPEDGIENQDSDCSVSHTTLWSSAIWLDSLDPGNGSRSSHFETCRHFGYPR